MSYDKKEQERIERVQAAKARKAAKSKAAREMTKRQPGNIVRTGLVIKAKAAVGRATAKRGGKPVTNRHGSLQTIGRKLANKGKRAISRASQRQRTSKKKK